MNYEVTILDVDTIDEIPGKWTRADYISLLECYDINDAGNESDADLKELLFLAINELEPQEAAARLLKHKLGNEFNDGQIEQISNDMLKENVSEHYSDISYHATLFDLNNLLYKAFNGKFPHAKATVITLNITPKTATPVTMDATLLLRCIAPLVDDHTLFKRLFKTQIDGDEAFEDATHIAWYIKDKGANTYELITSNYWISNAHFTTRHMNVTLAISL